MTTPVDLTTLGPLARKAIANALEELAFMSVDAPPENPAAGERCWAAIGAMGVPFGKLVVEAPVAMARRLAATALGVEETAISDSQALDALAEATNTACGQLARGFSESFDLGLPEKGSGALPPGETLAEELLGVDEYLLRARVMAV
ncbi:MAG: chemotaxis protein CheX [Deltaproteobacteria bacterium]|nr:chemotaxis protein CheX [Deltaproteobacteria bacterium]